MSVFVQLEINKKNRWVYFTKYRWVAHVGYWLWVLIFGTFLGVSVPITPSVIWNHFVLDNLLIAAFYYIYCLFLIPYYFKRNKNFLFWTLVVGSYLLLTALDVIYHNTFVHLTYGNGYDQPKMLFWDQYIHNLGGYLINFLLFSMMLFFMEKNEENDTFVELEKEKKEIIQVKLDLLKTNISPDFMMRSLGQLKQAATIDDPATPEAILTFSDLLRYRLYRGKQKQTPLAEELEALCSFVHFIALNKTNNNLEVKLSIQGDAENKYLAPLALINIVELFCKLPAYALVDLQIIILIEETALFLEMSYGKKADETLISDLEEYGDNYKNLYGSSIKFHYENCEDERCLITLSLPITEDPETKEKK